MAPAGTPNEFVDGTNIGLGFRTPTTIVSPWTAGGFVCRQICGDLTSAFRFGNTPSGYPATGELGLAVTESRLLRAQAQVNDNPFPVPPAVNEPPPTQ